MQQAPDSLTSHHPACEQLLLCSQNAFGFRYTRKVRPAGEGMRETVSVTYFFTRLFRILLEIKPQDSAATFDELQVDPAGIYTL